MAQKYLVYANKFDRVSQYCKDLLERVGLTLTFKATTTALIL